MPAELQLGVEQKSTIGDRLVTWMPRLALAILFVKIGASKFDANGTWVRIFARIGFGQWFRYLAGVLQVGGALLLLVPRTVVAGAVLLGCTLGGAPSSRSWWSSTRSPRSFQR